MRLAAYANDLDAGSTWEEVERSRSGLGRGAERIPELTLTEVAFAKNLLPQ